MLSMWRHEDQPQQVTFDRVAELAVRFASRLAATGIHSLWDATPEAVAGFVHAPTRRGAPPAVHTMHLRRTVVRSIYSTLHDLDPTCSDPSAFLTLPSRWYRKQRPLTDPEMQQLRITTQSGHGELSPSAVLLALAECGAATFEITAVTWSDVTSTTLELPGGTRILRRNVAQSPFAKHTLQQAREQWNPSPEEPVVPTRSSKPPMTQPAISAMTNRLRQLIDRSGLRGADHVGPRSIRLWAAATEYRRTSRIEAAAQVLGMKSLDAAATAIGLTEGIYK